MQNVAGEYYQRAPRCCPNRSAPDRIKLSNTGRGAELLCCCCSCSNSPSTKTPGFLASLGVCILVLGYTLLGAFAFMALEGGLKSEPPTEIVSSSNQKPDASGSGGLSSSSSSTSSSSSSSAAASSGSSSSSSSSSSPSPSSLVPILEEDNTVVQLRAQTVERLWSLTEDLNVLYKENWTRLAAHEVLKFQESLARDLRSPLSHSVYESVIPTRRRDLHEKRSHLRRWTFSSSLLYSLTLITTIGYGSVAPRTVWGKLITIVYALAGIPLMLVYLSTVGDVLARSFRRLYGRICRPRSCARKQQPPPPPPPVSGVMGKAYRYDNHVETKGAGNFYAPSKESSCDDLGTRSTGSAILLDCGSEGLLHPTTSSTIALQESYNNGKRHYYPCTLSLNSSTTCANDLNNPVKVPITLCLLIIIVYICGGAVMFNRLEGWTLLEGGYFCFTSLGTIGFGDLLPAGKNAQNPTLEELSLCACCLYILAGMGLIAMCFNLVQEEVVRAVRVFGGGNGVKSEPDGGLGASTDSRLSEQNDEAIAMSVVSTS
ncbi:potassium channel subfamily K member 18-like isoform X2 [Leptopilina boulardi]|uniref:potassium channel subfamily K member 18-like isoform X2 n=1 Tax=Leptopilina boulardi TaxID=63433 RepID=UPI0021F5DAA3|nr:potassium channel subfamily K member 18-like isoform X2 [Leptopilina boulardi]